MKKPSLLNVIFSLLGASFVLFLLAPLLKMIFSVRAGSFAEALADADVQKSIVLTLVSALWATIIGAVLGVPLGYLLARRSFFGKRFIEALVDVPIVIPHPVAGIALLLVFGRQFFGGKFLSHFGLTIVGDVPGIVLAMLFVSAPFLINAARDGFLRVDPRLENVARTLGRGPWAAFFGVTVPLARGAIVSGAVMTWARALSAFGAV